jgi:glycosyltransferase involved in cell wall biosynthesis
MSEPGILFLSSWFPDRITRTNGDFVKRHAEAVASAFPVTFIFVKHDPSMASTRETVKSSTGNYREAIVYFRTKGRFLQRFRNTVTYFSIYRKEYRKLVRESGKPDIVHANITYPIGVVALYLKIRYGIPYVISEHWSAYLQANSGKLSPIRKKIDRLILKKAGCVMPVTQDLKHSMEMIGYKAKYCIVPNVVDVGKFKPAIIPSGTVKSFIHLSTLYDEVKNISGIIEAVRLLSLERQDFMVNMYGYAELEEHIKNAESAGINEKFIRFHGEIPYGEVPSKLPRSISLLLFSNYESLPCVIVEALACGIPVISTDVGGIKEYITAREGILVDRGNIRQLVEAMGYMLDHYPDFDKTHLREYADRHFSIRAIATQFGNIYRSVHSNG